MIKTTDEYKTLMGQTIRPPTYVRAEIQLVDPKITKSATFTQTGCESFSTDVSKGADVQYITFEENFYKMDGSQVILETTDVLPNGIVSRIGIDTVVNIRWDNNENLRGMTFCFDNPHVDNPFNLEIWLWTKTEIGEMVKERIGFYLTGETDKLFVDRDITNEIHRIQIKIKGSLYEESKRIRLTEVVLGEVFDVKASDIITSRQDIEYDYLSTSLFKNEVVLNIYDGDKKFHPDNEDGYWSRLKEHEKIKIYYGVGDNEILRNILYITDYKRTKENELQITCNSLLSILTDKWEKGLFHAPHSTNNEFSLLCDNLGLKYINKMTNSSSVEYPLPAVSIAECLQLIANAAGGTLYVDRDDNIVMTDVDSHEEDVKITFAEMFEKPSVDIKTSVKEVRVMVYDADYSGESTERYNSDWQTKTEDNSFIIEIPIDNPVISEYRLELGEGSTVSLDRDNSTLGAFMCRVALKGLGSFRLRILVRDVSLRKHVITIPVGNEGEICEIDNPLIMYDSDAEKIGRKIAEYYKKRKVYEMPVREDFSMETGDIVNFTNDLEQIHPGLITRLQFNIPGQTGAMEVRRWD